MFITLEKWQDIAKLCRKYERDANDRKITKDTQNNVSYYNGQCDAYAWIAELIEKKQIVVKPQSFNETNEELAT